MGLQLNAVESDPKYLAVTWQVNNFCNFKCSYCNPGNWGGTNKNNGNLEKYIANLNTIIDRYQASGYEEFKFFFSGGEPTVWENFIPIVQALRDRLPRATLAVNTNLSRSTQWWKDHYHLFDDVVASFHVEFANKERYWDNSIFLCDKVNYLATKMLMHEERFWEVVEYGEKIKEAMPNCVLEWTPLFDEMSVTAGPWKYKDQAKIDFINTRGTEVKMTVPKPESKSLCKSVSVWDDGSRSHTNSNELIVKRVNFFKGWECDIGDALFINPEGEMSLASCGQSSLKRHILNDISDVGPKTLICRKEHCHCGTDIIIPKRRVA
jgi:organic radical activating enzyme